MKISFAAVCLAISVAMAAEEVRLIPTVRHGTIGPGVSTADSVAADLDGDGVKELVSCSNGAPFAVSTRAGTFVPVFHGPSFGCYGLDAGDLDGDGGAEVITVAGDTIRIHDPRSLGAPVTVLKLPVAYEAAAVAVDNVDDDAAAEMIVVTNGATYIYDGATLELQWAADGYGGQSLRVGDIDGDARREVIVNGSTAYVLDAGAQAQKWGYAGGFSEMWDVGNLDADGKEEIVFRPAGNSTQVSILNGDTFAMNTWSVPDGYLGLAAGDADGDGSAEVVVGGTYYASVRGLAPADGTQLWSIGPDMETGLTLGVAELDGDDQPEVFWSRVGYYAEALFIGSTDKATPEWNSVAQNGPYYSAVADLDGDGTLEHIVATYATTNSYSSPGTIEIFDLATGVSERTLPFPATYNSNVAAVAVGQVDADAALEVVALVGYYDFRLMTWDGVTGALEFTSATTSYRGGDDALAIANIDADPVDEVFVLTSNQLVVLNGASNIIQQALPFNNTSVVDFSLADLNGDQVLDVAVATYSAVTIFDTSTWASLGSRAVNAAYDIEATSADGGTIALGAYYDQYTYIFKGVTLTPAWSCVNHPSELLFAEIGGETRLVVGDIYGDIRLYPLSGDTCPDPESIPVGTGIRDLTLADADGDGRDELLIDTSSSTTIALLGGSSEMRGDVDGDEVIAEDDIDAVADYLFGSATAMRPAGDANADERIGVEDLFYLINYEFAGGAAPLP